MKNNKLKNCFVGMTIYFTKCILPFANDYQFLCYVLKQCLSVLELIRAHWGILYCSPMFNWIDPLWCCCLKLGLHIVVRLAEHACDDALKRILKPSTCRLQIFLVRDQYLRSVIPHEDQTIAGQLEKHVLKPMLAILTTYMETRLKTQLMQQCVLWEHLVFLYNC